MTLAELRARVAVEFHAEGLVMKFRVRGVHRNPLTVPLPRANGLKKSERAKFLVAARGMLRRLASGSETKLAQAGTD